MHVYCRSGDDLHSIEIDADENVAGLKKAAYKALHLVHEDRGICFEGGVLDDDDVSLCDTGITTDSIVDVSLSKRETARIYLRELGVRRSFKSAISAAEEGNLPLFSALHDSGVDILQRERGSGNALFSAMAHPDICHYIVSHIRRKSAYLEETDPRGNTVLMHACWKGDLNYVKDLIQVGANVHAVNEDNDTPLVWAAMNGHQHVVEYLLSVVETHPDWMGVRRQYKAAVQGATSFQQHHIVECLERKLAEITAKHSICGTTGRKRTAKV